MWMGTAGGGTAKLFKNSKFPGSILGDIFARYSQKDFLFAAQHHSEFSHFV